MMVRILTMFYNGAPSSMADVYTSVHHTNDGAMRRAKKLVPIHLALETKVMGTVHRLTWMNSNGDIYAVARITDCEVE